MKKIIAICGSKRAGKDTLANIISNDLNVDFEHVKISQKLKTMCQTLFNFSDEQIETDLKEDIDPKWNITPRKAMQFMGTEIMQYKIQDLLGPGIGREFWINSLLESFDRQSRNYVISDLRFHHEYRRIRQIGGIIVKIVDNDIVNIDNHISENEFQQFDVDFIVDNTGRKGDLKQQAAQIIHASS